MLRLDFSPRGPLRHAVFAVVFFLLPATATAATAEDHFREWPIRDIGLSPDGSALAGIYRTERGYQTIVTNLATRQPRARIPEVKGTRMQSLHWLNDDRLLVRSAVRGMRGLVMSIVYDRDGDNPLRLLRDIASITERGRSPSVEIASVLPHQPDHVAAIVRQVVPGRVTSTLYMINVNNGRHRVLDVNHGYTIAYRLDENAIPRVRVDNILFTRRLVVYTWDDDKEKWQRQRSYRVSEQQEDLAADVAFLDGRDHLLSLDRRDSDEFVKLHRLDARTNDFVDVRYERPDGDLHGVVMSHHSEDLVGVSYVTDTLRYAYFQEEHQSVQTFLEGRFPGSEVRIESISRNDERYLFRVADVWHPGTYYLYDRRDNRQIKLGSLTPHLAPETTVERVEYVVDGIRIEGYLTLPIDVDGALPLIIMPHGGPQARDWLQYDPTVQFLSAQGYAVLQTNFRGSAGYGRGFEEAGYQRWGTRMIDDIVASIDALKDDKRINRDQICSMGFSYGGYAALMLATRVTTIRCAISVNGVSDLRAMVKEKVANVPSGDHKQDMREWFGRTLGDPVEDRDRLDAESPIYRIDQIKVPVLLMHSVDDENVNVKQSRRMHSALKRAKRSSEYVELERGGHHLRRGSLLQVMKTAETFLDQHL